MSDGGHRPIYALNLFDVADREEYLAYSRRSAAEVERHGGRVVSLGRFSEAIQGDIEPRQAMIVVEWVHHPGNPAEHLALAHARAAIDRVTNALGGYAANWRLAGISCCQSTRNPESKDRWICLSVGMKTRR